MINSSCYVKQNVNVSLTNNRKPYTRINIPNWLYFTIDFFFYFTFVVVVAVVVAQIISQNKNSYLSEFQLNYYFGQIHA